MSEKSELEKLQESLHLLHEIIHDMTVANQAAWIEWKHGKGAEAAMKWIHNGLAGPGFIPDENEEYGKNAQFYYNANKSDPFPKCYCGNPSSILSNGHGACCQEHMNEINKSGGNTH